MRHVPPGPGGDRDGVRRHPPPGVAPEGLGQGPDGTRWADWLDLAIPWLVVGPAALTLWAARPQASAWVIFGAGAIAYTSGHGVHLAANSIHNADGGATAHLWDEPVGHHLWFAGAALIGVALAMTMVGRPPSGLVGIPFALAVGVTWATNGIGGGTELFSLVVALAATTAGWRHRRSLAVLLVVGFLPAALVLAGALAGAG